MWFYKMGLKKILINFLHVHDWEYFNKEIPEHRFEADGPYFRYRVCSKCEKVEVVDTHCLGLNPPEYISKWYSVKGKPRFKMTNGTLEIVKILKEN